MVSANVQGSKSPNEINFAYGARSKGGNSPNHQIVQIQRSIRFFEGMGKAWRTQSVPRRVKDED